MVKNVEGSFAGSDYYLLGPDFGSYCDAQVRGASPRLCSDVRVANRTVGVRQGATATGPWTMDNAQNATVYE